MAPRIQGEHKSRERGVKTQAYGTWARMLHRCSSGRQPQYKDCKVCDDWLDFQVFAGWYKSQRNNSKRGYELDKDLLFHGNKLYSPETCCILPEGLNSFLASYNKKSSRDLPTGISWSHTKEKYYAKITINDKWVSLGIFRSLEEACLEYAHAKRERLQELIDMYRVDLGFKELQALYRLPMPNVLT